MRKFGIRLVSSLVINLNNNESPNVLWREKMEKVFKKMVKISFFIIPYKNTVSPQRSLARKLVINKK